jgi:hypothetical protein
MKIKYIVVLGLTTFSLMAFAGCGGDDSADTTAETPPPETTAAPELPAEAVVALDGLNASLDRLKLLAASFPDCGKEPQIRRERLRARRLAEQLGAAPRRSPWAAAVRRARAIFSGTYRRNRNYPAADEIAIRWHALAETEVSILPALRACRDQREREQAAQEARG